MSAVQNIHGHMRERTVSDLYRREHYLHVEGPRDWTDREFARWLLAVALWRDGRVDAIVAADGIIPPQYPPSASARLAHTQPAAHPVREQAALCVAIWVAFSGACRWPIPRIASGFRMEVEEVIDVLDLVAAEINAGTPREFRDGLSDVSFFAAKRLLEAGPR